MLVKYSLKNIELYTVLLKQKNWKLIKHWYFVCYKIQFLYKICRMKPGFLNTDITIKYTKQYQMRTPTVAYISYALYLKKLTFIYMYSLSYPVITLSISLTPPPPPFLETFKFHEKYPPFLKVILFFFKFCFMFSFRAKAITLKRYTCTFIGKTIFASIKN